MAQKRKKKKIKKEVDFEKILRLLAEKNLQPLRVRDIEISDSIY